MQNNLQVPNKSTILPHQTLNTVSHIQNRYFLKHTHRKYQKKILQNIFSPIDCHANQHKIHHKLKQGSQSMNNYHKTINNRYQSEYTTADKQRRSQVLDGEHVQVEDTKKQINSVMKSDFLYLHNSQAFKQIEGELIENGRQKYCNKIQFLRSFKKVNRRNVLSVKQDKLKNYCNTIDSTPRRNTELKKNIEKIVDGDHTRINILRLGQLGKKNPQQKNQISNNSINYNKCCDFYELETIQANSQTNRIKRKINRQQAQRKTSEQPMISPKFLIQIGKNCFTRPIDIDIKNLRENKYDLEHFAKNPNKKYQKKHCRRATSNNQPKPQHYTPWEIQAEDHDLLGDMEE